ncbi:hypothetical protein B0H66DRAFT_219255 [Apodospora peruviana]|uniref:Transmembrane protein n=1 Tax=Apodospora peruviana TaxID=516989 RepID=A0AAE0IDL7_9PEZI|nr:hypothetical protein B0H66DRAFT_219255 [Apodospora peruviana]
MMDRNALVGKQGVRRSHFRTFVCSFSPFPEFLIVVRLWSQLVVMMSGLCCTAGAALARWVGGKSVVNNGRKKCGERRKVKMRSHDSLSCRFNFN